MNGFDPSVVAAGRLITAALLVLVAMVLMYRADDSKRDRWRR